MITATDKKIAAAIVKDSKYEVFLKFAKALIDQWMKESVKADSTLPSAAFQTTWNTAYKEGKIDGVNTLIDELEKQVFEHE